MFFQCCIEGTRSWKIIFKCRKAGKNNNIYQVVVDLSLQSLANDSGNPNNMLVVMSFGNLVQCNLHDSMGIE